MFCCHPISRVMTGAVVGGVLLVAVAVVTLFSVMACVLRRRKQSKSEEGGQCMWS